MEISERGNEEPQNQEPRNLLKDLQKRNPEQKIDVAVIAMNQLTSEEEVKQFFGEYIKDFKNSGVEDPERVAIGNIRWFLGKGEKEIEMRWKKALPDIFIDFPSDKKTPNS